MAAKLGFDETSRTASFEGLDLHYHDAGTGDDVLILLHGAGPGVSGWSNFSGNLGHYAEHFRTIIVDMPGFGKSAHPAEYDRSYLQYSADAVVSLMDELGIAKAHLLGNSLGGSVAARFVLAYPDRAKRIVLMGPGSALSIGLFAPRPSEGIRRLMEFQLAPEKTKEKMEAFLRSMVFDQSLINDELIEQRFGTATDPATAGGLKAMQVANQKFPTEGELWREAGEIKHDVLITWGREDRVQPLDGAFVGFRLLENARLHVFPKNVVPAEFVDLSERHFPWRSTVWVWSVSDRPSLTNGAPSRRTSSACRCAMAPTAACSCAWTTAPTASPSCPARATAYWPRPSKSAIARRCTSPSANSRPPAWP
jgi:4,5:9,10-diseco-3-hydroxy-5,9,17-trioxoandrosta-1(10),2-diene-4-oate hydrolase